RPARGGSHRRRERVAGVPPDHGAAPVPRPDGRLHHDADLRPQGVRHRDRDRPGLGAGRRERDRAGDVEDVVRRRQRLRPRIRDRRLPVPARDPGAADQHPPLQEGGLMAVAEERVVLQESFATRASRGLARTPVYLLIAFIGILWLIPTIGLFFTSVLDPSVIGRVGWWHLLSSPSEATFDNYRAIFKN